MMAGTSSKVTGALALVLILSFLHPLYAGQPDGLDHKFTEDDRHYAFRGSFQVTGTERCLMEVIYDFQHISRYAAGARSVEKGLEGENWYEVTYTYRRYLLFKNRSTWRRTLDRAERRVDFEMTASENNLGMLPELLSSTGYYQLAEETQGYRLEYFQECSISHGAFGARYLKRARKEAIGFLEEFRQYVMTTCQ
jgi:hypothetical protein